MTLLKQPLIQFLLLGALVFGVDHWVAGNQDDPHRILIDDARYAEIAGIYRDNQGREPSEREMSSLVVTWAQNEVMYREAQSMGLAKGDEMIRQRLILKMRNILFNRLVIQPPDETGLREWFEQNRDRYDQPATFDLEQFKIGGPGKADEAASLATQLGAGEPTEPWLPQLRRYEHRSTDNLELVFGTEQAATLTAGSIGRWQAVESPAGWHVARITAHHPYQPADFDAIKVRVGEDWKSQANQAELAQTLRAIAARYDIRIELTTPPEKWDAKRIETERLSMQMVP